MERICQLASEETERGSRHVESKNHGNSRASPLPTSFFISVCAIYYLDNGVKTGGNPVRLLSHTGCQTGGLSGGDPGLVEPEAHTVLRYHLKKYKINMVTKAIKMKTVAT